MKADPDGSTLQGVTFWDPRKQTKYDDAMFSLYAVRCILISIWVTANRVHGDTFCCRLVKDDKLMFLLNRLIVI